MKYFNGNGQAAKRLKRFFGAASWLIIFYAGIAWAQNTTITYQGKLTDAGNPANGNYDLQFKLFDTVTVGTGTQQGEMQERNSVAVSAGNFSVMLDFGATVFGGADRYLEIGVRPANSPDAYTVLAPRQQLTSSPYAIQTLNAQKLGGLPASGFVQNTTAPQTGASFNIDGSGTASAFSLSGSAPPAVAPAGQGLLYFDTATNKVKVSESGAAFVNLVGATGVSGGGTVNSIPLWSAGTTLGTSLITQSGNAVQLPTAVQLAIGAQGNQVQFGSPNGETGMSISGTSGRADLRFDGTLKLVAGSGGIPAATNGLSITTAGNVGIGTTSPLQKLHVDGTEILSTGSLAGFKFRNRGSLVNTDNWVLYSENNVARLFRQNTGDLLTVTTTGNVGIGTIGTSTSRLEIAANDGLKIFGFQPFMTLSDTGAAGKSGFVQSVNGDVLLLTNSRAALTVKDVSGLVSVSTLQITGGADLSENFEISNANGPGNNGLPTSILPGMIVSINPQSPGKLVLSNRAYDRRVAGIISGAGEVQPGLTMGQEGSIAAGNHPVALSGRVYCWVDASKRSIKPGDLLTTSAIPGHAMKVTDHAKGRGATIGKAMTGLKSGRGLVLVLVTLQ